MVDYLRDFIKVLRSSDVRISTSETIDAMHAASLVGIEDKEMLKVSNILWINFNDDIYGKELTVEFLTFIRPEQKFDNFEKLTEQIKKDIVTAKFYHKI